jgi:hypothetical protein
MAALSTLYSLTKSERAAWPFVKALNLEDLTQTEALQEYRSAGGRIANASWSDLWHAAEGEINYSRAAQQANPSKTISLAKHAISQTQLSDNFSYQVSYQGYNKQTQSVETIYRTITSSERLSPNQVTSFAPSTIGQSGSTLIVEPDSITFESALVSFDYDGL